MVLTPLRSIDLKIITVTHGVRGIARELQQPSIASLGLDSLSAVWIGRRYDPLTQIVDGITSVQISLRKKAEKDLRL